MKNKILAALAALTVGLGVFAGASTGTTGPYFGITFDSKDPVKYPLGYCQITASTSWSGTAAGSFEGQVQVMRYTGTGWVGVGAIQTYSFTNGVAYNGTTTMYRQGLNGAYTYLVRSRIWNLDHQVGSWDNSAGKNIAC